MPLSLGVKMKLGEVPAAYAAPFLVAVQARARPAAVSAVLGSVADPPRLMAVPSVVVEIGAPMVGVGATLSAATVAAAEPTPPSLSVAVTATAYVPLSLGVNVNVGPVPVANVWPPRVTVHASGRPAAVSTGLGSVAAAVSVTAEPSDTCAAGTPARVTAGATFVTAAATGVTVPGTVVPRRTTP